MVLWALTFFLKPTNFWLGLLQATRLKHFQTVLQPLPKLSLLAAMVVLGEVEYLRVWFPMPESVWPFCNSDTNSMQLSGLF